MAKSAQRPLQEEEYPCPGVNSGAHASMGSDALGETINTDPSSILDECTTGQTGGLGIQNKPYSVGSVQPVDTTRGCNYMRGRRISFHPDVSNLCFCRICFKTFFLGLFGHF
jgi:hypothetical protein